MARKKRICIPGVTYHVFSRCIETKNMMNLNKVKDMLISVLDQVLEKYTFDLSTFVIMDNHFHFLITTIDGGEDISKILQFIKSQFARKYNKMMNRTGPFWNERFGDTIIEHANDPVFVFNYIIWYFGYNPVRSGYVNDPRDYTYSTINYYLDQNFIPPVKLKLHKYFIQLGNTFQDRLKKFLEFEELYRKRINLDCLSF
jgi:putative transposase